MKYIPVVDTKFIPPPVRENFVPRMGLYHQLDQVLEKRVRLILVTAPAGFGKTYFATTWSQRLEQKCAWLNLDHEDNDPILFWLSIVRSIQKCIPSFGQNIVMQIHSYRSEDLSSISGYRPGERLKELLILLINEINQINERVFLFLDDFHCITAVKIFADFSYFLEYLPDNMVVMILARYDPMLPLASLRARDLLAEIRMDELRFSKQEMREFVLRFTGIPLGEQDLSALDRLINGWAVGLQAAVLSLGKQETPSFYLNSNSGLQKHLLDYLTEEVLVNETEETRWFLLATSILDRFNPALCDYLMNEGEMETDSRKLMDGLEKRNLFLIPLDLEHQWYRYHDLFSELLQTLLHRMHPQSVRGLKIKASEWLEKNGLIQEALDQLLSIRAYEFAAKVVERQALPHILQGKIITVHSWLNSLPVEIVHGSQRLCLDLAWVYSLSGHSYLASQMLSYITEVFAGKMDASLQAEVVVFSAHMHYELVDPDESISQLQAIVEAPHLKTSCVYSMALFMLAILESGTGNLKWGEKYYHLGLNSLKGLAETTSPKLLMNRFQYEHSMLFRNLGDLRKARSYLEELLRQETISHLENFPSLLQIQTAMGKILMAQGLIAQAEEFLATGKQLDPNIQTVLSFNSYYNFIRLLIVKNEISNAGQLLEELTRRYRNIDDPIMSQFDELWALVYCARGDFNWVRRWIDQKGFFEEHSQFQPKKLIIHQFLYEFELLIAGKYLVMSKQFEFGERFLHNLRAFIEAHGNIEHRIDVLLLLALLYDQDGKADKAIGFFEEALQLASKSWFVFPFLEKGHLIVSLLENTLQENLFPDFVFTILAHLKEFYGTRRAEGQSGRISQMIPPETSKHEKIGQLTRREIEIINLMAQGLTDDQIAQTLSIAVGTVKTHNHKIYEKLNSPNRTHAVDQCRKLGILTD